MSASVNNTIEMNPYSIENLAEILDNLLLYLETKLFSQYEMDYREEYKKNHNTYPLPKNGRIVYEIFMPQAKKAAMDMVTDIKKIIANYFKKSNAKHLKSLQADIKAFKKALDSAVCTDKSHEVFLTKFNEYYENELRNEKSFFWQQKKEDIIICSKKITNIYEELESILIASDKKLLPPYFSKEKVASINHLAIRYGSILNILYLQYEL